MVSKKNMTQNSRINPQQRQMPYKKPPPPKPPMMQGFNSNPMFNVSQIPDNPGYLDFNLPTPPNAANNSNTANGRNVNNNNINKNANNSGDVGARKKNNKNKPKNNIKPPGMVNGPNLGWKITNHPPGGGMGLGPKNIRFNGGIVGGGPRNFGHQMVTRRGSRMMPPMGSPCMGMGPMGPPMPRMGFQPPMMGPLPPMGRGGPPIPPPMGVQPPPPPFMRRGNGPVPPPIPPMMAPRLPRGIPPAPFIAGGPGVGKIKKNKPPKKVPKGKSTIKTLKNLINQYPIDKPWVTAEIRAEYDKKVDIENRLKGNKDDDLFAQFKVQRDKFVSLYETAREEFLKKEAAAVKAKDEKDKQTNTNSSNTKDDKKEAIKNENKKN